MQKEVKNQQDAPSISLFKKPLLPACPKQVIVSKSVIVSGPLIHIWRISRTTSKAKNAYKLLLKGNDDTQRFVSNTILNVSEINTSLCSK